MDILLPLLLLSGLAILNKKSSSGSSNSGEYGFVKNGKFVPKKQPSFKNQLNEILIDLEEKLEIEDLRDFLMGVAWVESKYYPSAIRYETLDKDRIVDIKIIISQGATAYMPTIFKVNSVTSSVSWLDSATPSATASKTNVFEFSIINYITPNIEILGKINIYG